MKWFLILFVSLPVWVVLALALKGPFLEFSLEEILTSGMFTFKQAFLSALISTLLGGCGAFGLLAFKGVSRKIFEGISLLPTVFPSLFLILATLSFTEIFFEFPYGLWGIVLVHSLINIGLAAVLIARTIEQKLGPAIIWAWLSAIPKRHILYHGVLRALKWDLSRVFFVIFLFCWCSFTVPYLVGTLHLNTLEVLLFEQIKIHVDWQQASVIALLQLLMIWMIGLIFLKKDTLNSKGLDRGLEFLSFKGFILFPLSVVAILFYGSLNSLLPGLKKLISEPELQKVILQSSVVSVGLGLCAALGTVIFSVLILWSWSPLVRRFFILYQSPSALILGFLFIYYFGNTDYKILTTGLGIAFLYLPFIYKLSLDSKFLSLESYHQTSKLLGASHLLTFQKVSLPLARPAITLAAAVCGFWAVGDYALSALFLTSTPSLPIVIEQLISTYRFDLASALIWINLFIGVIVFLIPLGVDYVYSQKS